MNIESNYLIDADSSLFLAAKNKLFYPLPLGCKLEDPPSSPLGEIHEMGIPPTTYRFNAIGKSNSNEDSAAQRY
ncbi:MAG: hypothetical protein ACKVHR_09200 [Pirellulales bacterium]